MTSATSTRIWPCGHSVSGPIQPDSFAPADAGAEGSVNERPGTDQPHGHWLACSPGNACSRIATCAGPGPDRIWVKAASLSLCKLLIELSTNDRFFDQPKSGIVQMIQCVARLRHFAWGAGGRGFESRRPDQEMQKRATRPVFRFRRAYANTRTSFPRGDLPIAESSPSGRLNV